ncbi:MAG: MotA/TolQ/ExbB proton channel family protein [Gammaproteobacteria bacterium]
MRLLLTTLAIIILLSPIPGVYAAKPASLDDLLDQVKKQRLKENQNYAIREKRFMREKNRQQKLYEDAQKRLSIEEQRSKQYKQVYDTNEEQLAKQDALLKERAGDIGELHGIVRQTAGDINSIQKTSLVTAQYPDRSKLTAKLAASKELPAFKELEDLWLLLLDEIAESGKVVKFPAKLITLGGDEVEQQVIRVGVFDAISQNRFLRYLPETGKLIEPGRQPSARYQQMAARLADSSSGEILPMPIDPTRGSMLALLVQVPDMKARIKQGGIVGYIIIAVALIGLLIAVERFIKLSLTGRMVQRQLKSKNPGKNPLGRIMQVYENNPDVDTETLELKLDEAILKEMPALERGLGALALLAAIAPLLGLLGTVTGIIGTFQSITLYGTGDPRVMSGGISQALVTTVMGLVVAIPILLVHSYLSAKSNNLINILDEKSKAFVALLAEINRLRQHHG